MGRKNCIQLWYMSTVSVHLLSLGLLCCHLSRGTEERTRVTVWGEGSVGCEGKFLLAIIYIYENIIPHLVFYNVGWRYAMIRKQVVTTYVLYVYSLLQIHSCCGFFPDREQTVVLQYTYGLRAIFSNDSLVFDFPTKISGLLACSSLQRSRTVLLS